MKKALIMLLCAAMGATVMASCDGATTSSEDSSSSADETSSAADESEDESEDEEETLSGSLTVTGSTSMEKLAKALAGAFEAKYDVTVTVGGGGSSTGMTDAIDGRADIGMASRKLKDEELESLEATVVGIDGIAMIVSNDNAVSDMTMEDLQKIYTGEISNWSELGGADAQIVVIGREEGSGTRDGFESVVMGDAEAVYGQELESTGAVINAVETNANAIGYASLANVGDSTKTLLIGGVAPTDETIKDESYAIQRPFNMAVTQGNDNELVAAFMEFVMSDEGQEQVVSAGCVSPK